MPGKTGASPFSRNRATRLSRSSSFTRRVRKRSSENWLWRRSPNVRGTLMNGTPRNYDGLIIRPVRGVSFSVCSGQLRWKDGYGSKARLRTKRSDRQNQEAVAVLRTEDSRGRPSPHDRLSLRETELTQ